MLLVAAPVLAVACAVLVDRVTERQQEDFEAQALAEARSVLVAVPDDLGTDDAEALGRAVRRPGDLEVLVVDADGGVSRSDQRLDIDTVPQDLRQEGRDLGGDRVTIDGSTYFVAGGSTGARPTSVFLFFSEQDLQSERTRTMVAAIGGAAALLVVTAGAGWAHSSIRLRDVASRRVRERAFTAHLAHELRTPVGAMVTAASLVDRLELRHSSEELRRPVEVMQVQARRLRRIVEDLLELSRLETGQVELDPEPVDVAQVVRETVEAYGWEGVLLELEDDALVITDRQSLARLLLNLIGNAEVHARGTARVTVRSDRSGAVVEIADDGDGLDPAMAAVLTGSAHSSGAGPAGRRGLGLTIARAHAALLGADVDVRADREGTCIVVGLPPVAPTPGGGRPVGA